MPKTKFQNIVFTIIMAVIMVYGMIVCIMCPTMSLIATLLFKEPSLGAWVQTFGMNMPMALIWQLLFCGPLVRLIFRTLFHKQLNKEKEMQAETINK